MGASASIPAGVPSYAVDYAPMVYLYTGETYFPSDLGAQLTNTQPEVNFTVVNGAPNPLTLDNLDQLNTYGGKSVYLSSKQDPATNPSWLNGVVPDSVGKTNGAVSCGIIVNDHGAGLVDVFYMYFYAFNYGGFYFGQDVDLHVGDWEHNMVRFMNGQPTGLWYSQHSNGEAFTYDATEKYNGGLRPVAYSGNGSHAVYATSGTHDHTIPNFNLPVGPIEDYCDKGKIWDPTLSAYYAKYDANTKTFSAYDDSTPLNWLNFLGEWGDQAFPQTDPRQSCPGNISLLCKWSGGPTGPYDKQLNRTNICPDNGNACIVRPFLTAK
ncbi:hypothetical protein AMS68_004754 [Peltaster fructicola]|uniref:Vacuolar protein sorting-associated protein 62 n=1 Tax=Peltaster fructicola TaxID=286661 RepID=A0A6H0XWU2_9PEZI|nr:hypothetical protein AMS68_004754 [Peltaster fructicola]